MFNKIWKKLAVSFLIMIGLTIVVGVVALISQNRAQTTVNELINVDVRIAELSLESSNAELEARRREKDYLLRYKSLSFEEARSEYVTKVQTQAQLIRDNMAEINRLEIHKDDIALTNTVSQAVTEYETTFLATVDLLEQRGHVDIGLEGQFRADVHDIEVVIEAQDIDQLAIDMLTIRRREKDYLLRGEEKYVTEVRQEVANLKTHIAAETNLTPTEKTQLLTLADEYLAGFNQLVEIEAQVAASIETYRAAVHTLEDPLAELLTNAQQQQKDASDNLEKTAQIATLTVISVSALAAVIGLSIAFFLSRTITNSVNVVVRAAQGIAAGNLEQYVEVTTRDEFGTMARAFEQMIANLRNLIGQVQQSAVQVADASGQLNSMSEQAGLASQQVTSTIQQVARGNNEQTLSLTGASNSVEQIAHAANGIARGAQEQAQAVQNTSDLINEMAIIVEQVGDVTSSMTEATGKVNAAAGHGVTAVEQSNQGMSEIRTRTLSAAEKVKEMNIRSKEISRIVETIDNIADKTDMLALNAAVEAARAGEHGRGFAVVADQVRKLSEDSKEATRDIDQLIERVQETINEAIAAMEGVVTEVDSGSQLAGDTAQSLQEILQAAKESAVMSERISQAAGELREKSEGMVNTSTTVSAVVEENTAVAEEMAANSQEVTTAMESVAGVAEENSAAAEQVSASAEEMSAQIEEVIASSEELSALTEQLHTATAQFVVTEG